MLDQPVITDQCVWKKQSANAKMQVFELANGKYKGVVHYQTPRMREALTFETVEADDIPQARQFIYFILHEVSEYQ